MDSIPSIGNAPIPSSSQIAGASKKLSPKEEAEVEKLQKRDREVHQHEQAHKMVAGQYAIGAPNYEYKIGPDGKRYAVSGEVTIDTSPVRGNPEATIKKAKVVRRAALAPTDPSPQDRRVATQASAMEREARVELARKQRHGGVIDIIA